jgi:vancomycin resistance protein VanJ
MTTTSATPQTVRTSEQLTRWLAWASLAWLLAVWIALDLVGDRIWWTVPFLYGPRWLLAAPWLGCVPWLLVAARRAVLPAMVGLGVAAFPIIGLHLGLHRASVGAGISFRVLELNADGGGGDAMIARIIAEIEEQRPDLVVVVECSTSLAKAFGALTTYQLRTGNAAAQCMLSRGPITLWEQRDQMDVWKQGGAGTIIRAVVTTAAGPVRVGIVHLVTPRNALGNYFDLSELPKQGPLTRANMAQRDEESGLARAWILAIPGMPTIVAGDFNLPVESVFYRRNWGDFRNAFGRAGFGTGYTKFTRRWGVRIDHILTTSDIGTHDSFIGGAVGSDHLPLIADLVLPRPQRTTTTR